jgi:hypothetical protein
VTPILAIVFLVTLAALALPASIHAAPGARSPGAPAAWGLHLPDWLASWLAPLRGWFSGDETTTTGSGPVAIYGREGSSIDPDGTPSGTSTTSAGPVTLSGQSGSSGTL